jgi:carboxypeptidase Q
VLAGLHALFNQDNGTGRVVRINAAGLPDAAQHMGEWLAQVPTDLSSQINLPAPARRPAAAATTRPSPATACPPSASARLVELRRVHLAHEPRHLRQGRVRRPEGERHAHAMLAYLAADSPTKIARDRIDLGGGRDWPAVPAGAALW